jgi:polyphosphate kinase
VSDNIRVISVVDRFLEHARIFCFENGGKREVYLSSADWMPRNFVRRVEVMFPIEDEALRNRLVDEILALSLADNLKARQLMPDGSYQRLAPPADQPDAAMRSQQRFVQLARDRAHAAELKGSPPGRGDRARTVTRSPKPETVWAIGTPGAPPGDTRLAS